MSLFFVDNSCDLNFNEINKLGIEFFSIPYLINDEEFKFDETFDYEKFFSKVRKGIVLTNKLLTSDEYMNVFEPALKNGDDIVYVHSSSEVYSIENLLKARELLLDKYSKRKFELIDSKNFSTGYASVAIELALKYKNGNSVDELVEMSYDCKDKVATYLIVNSLENLMLNGLVDRNSSLGSSLNVNYILAIDLDGKFKVVDKIVGRKRAISKLCQIIRQQGLNIKDYPLIIANSGNSTDANDLSQKLNEFYDNDLKLIIQKMSPTTTAIIGLNAISLSFHIYRKIN